MTICSKFCSKFAVVVTTCLSNQVYREQQFNMPICANVRVHLSTTIMRLRQHFGSCNDCSRHVTFCITRRADIITDRNAKVMFSQASVILFTDVGAWIPACTWGWGCEDSECVDSEGVERDVWTGGVSGQRDVHPLT